MRSAPNLKNGRQLQRQREKCNVNQWNRPQGLLDLLWLLKVSMKKKKNKIRGEIWCLYTLRESRVTRLEIFQKGG